MNKLLVPTTLLALISTSHALEGTNLINSGGGLFPGQNSGSTSFDPTRSQLDNIGLAMGLNEVDEMWQPQLMAAQKEIEMADVLKRQCETDKSNQIMEADLAASQAKAGAVASGVQSGVSMLQPMMQNAGHGVSVNRKEVEQKISTFPEEVAEQNKVFGGEYLSYSREGKKVSIIKQCPVTGADSLAMMQKKQCDEDVLAAKRRLQEDLNNLYSELSQTSAVGSALATGALALTVAGIPIAMQMKAAKDQAGYSKKNAAGNYQVCILNAELAKQQAIRNLNMLNEQYSRAKLNATLADQARRLQQAGDTKNFDMNDPSLGSGTIGNLGDMGKLPGGGDKNPANTGGGLNTAASTGAPPGGGGGGGSGGGAGGGDKGNWSFGSLDSKSFQESLPDSPGGVAMGPPSGGGGAGGGKNNFDDSGKGEGDGKIAAEGSLDNALKGELGAAAMVGDGGIRVLMTRARRALENHAHELMASSRMPAQAKAPVAAPVIPDTKAPIQPTLKSNLQ